MAVKIKYPSMRGHDETVFSVEDAKTEVDLKLQNHCIVAINNRLVRRSDSLKDGDSVTVFPPVSGG